MHTGNLKKPSRPPPPPPIDNYHNRHSFSSSSNSNSVSSANKYATLAAPSHRKSSSASLAASNHRKSSSATLGPAGSNHRKSSSANSRSDYIKISECHTGLPTVYRTVDFLKTDALNKCKLERTSGRGSDIKGR